MKKVWWVLLLMLAVPAFAFDDDEEKAIAPTVKVVKAILDKIPNGCGISYGVNIIHVRLSPEVPRSVLVTASDEVRATLPEDSEIKIRVCTVEEEVKLRSDRILDIMAEITGIEEMGKK